MAYDIDTEPIIIRVPASAAIPAGDLTPAEVADLKARVDATENKALGDLADVSTDGATSGMALVHDGTGWTPGSVTGAIGRVQNGPNSKGVDGVTTIVAGFGLDIDEPPPGEAWVVVRPIYGTASSTIAEGNHTHSIRPDTQLTFSASGSFSSGTRTLVSGTVTGLDPARTYVLRGVLDVQLRGDGSGAGYTRPRITINGNSVDMPERPRNVAGVQPCYTMRHPGVQVSGVSSVPVNATIAYSEGDPTWVGGGALTISIEANR